MPPIEDNITLNEFCEKLYISLCDQLENTASEIDNIIHISKRAIEATGKVLDELHNYIRKYKFDNHEDEIHFFKLIKPKFHSQLIYHLKILRIESRRPIGSTKTEEIYLQEELNQLTYYYENNIDFYQYYRTSSTFLDTTYFTRGKFDTSLSFDECYISSDPLFSTTHDHKVAKILANELLNIYLKRSLEKLQDNFNARLSNANNEFGLSWTGTKAALIELIYALQSTGVLNHGNADVKQIAAFLQKALQIDLGNYYRTFQEIRIRKKNRTQFLDQLREKLVLRMDEADENYRY